jgi:hypothetical protein
LVWPDAKQHLAKIKTKTAKEPVAPLLFWLGNTAYPRLQCPASSCASPDGINVFSSL